MLLGDYSNKVEIDTVSGGQKMPTCKHVLISAVGLTPQIITETLYYFWCCAVPKIPVTEVFALTTSLGRQVLETALLSSTPNRLDKLSQDYELPKICFDSEHIYVLKGSDGQMLNDISNVRDNEALADQIFAFIRDMASDPELRLHVSIAGGRKTMGLYLGLAMQFYGRPGDTLSHVLVNPELESNPNFFYPPPDVTSIPLGDGRAFPAEQVHVELARIPLLLLREKIPFLSER